MKLSRRPGRRVAEDRRDAIAAEPAVEPSPAAAVERDATEEQANLTTDPMWRFRYPLGGLMILVLVGLVVLAVMTSTLARDVRDESRQRAEQRQQLLDRLEQDDIAIKSIQEDLLLPGVHSNAEAIKQLSARLTQAEADIAALKAELAREGHPVATAPRAPATAGGSQASPTPASATPPPTPSVSPTLICVPLVGVCF